MSVSEALTGALENIRARTLERVSQEAAANERKAAAKAKREAAATAAAERQEQTPQPALKYKAPNLDLTDREKIALQRAKHAAILEDSERWHITVAKADERRPVRRVVGVASGDLPAHVVQATLQSYCGVAGLELVGFAATPKELKASGADAALSLGPAPLALANAGLPVFDVASLPAPRPGEALSSHPRLMITGSSSTAEAIQHRHRPDAFSVVKTVGEAVTICERCSCGVERNGVAVVRGKRDATYMPSIWPGQVSE